MSELPETGFVLTFFFIFFQRSLLFETWSQFAEKKNSIHTVLKEELIPNSDYYINIQQTF